MPGSVLFSGWYGQLNAGDDAYCAVAAHLATTEWGISAPRFSGRPSLLPPLPGEATGVTPEPPVIRGRTRLAHLAAAIRAGSVIHLGGSTFRKPLRSHRDLWRARRLGLIDLAAASISVGPFRAATDSRGVSRLLRDFRSISVRDSASLRRVEHLEGIVDLHLGFDAAVLLPEVIGWTKSRQAKSRPILGVSVCPPESSQGEDRGPETERLNRLLAVVAAVVDRTGCHVRLLSMCAHPHWGDDPVTDWLAGRLDGTAEVSVRRYSGDTSLMFEAAATCDAVVAMRLHAAIFAYAAGVPFFISPYARKCVDFAHEVGLPEERLFPIEGPELRQADTIVRALSEDTEPPGLPLGTARERAREGLQFTRPTLERAYEDEAV